MRGRYPADVAYVDKLAGDTSDKERLKAILETLFGEARLLEALAARLVAACDWQLAGIDNF